MSVTVEQVTGFGTVIDTFQFQGLAAAKRFTKRCIADVCGRTGAEVAERFRDPDTGADVVTFAGGGPDAEPLAFRLAVGAA